MTKDFSIQRQQLIYQLQQNGISNERVLQAIAMVPREIFVDSSFQPMAYANQALPLFLGQTISQPLMVALMTQALQLTGSEKVLEVGTGSGYQTSILAQLCQHVYSVERYPQLSDHAASRLDQLGCSNVSLLVGDGSIGWADYAPYDRILVTAAAPQVPSQLVEQLSMDGFVVVPVGDQAQQDLQVVQRTHKGIQAHSLGRCVFVPLIGEGGWR